MAASFQAIPLPCGIATRFGAVLLRVPKQPQVTRPRGWADTGTAGTRRSEDAMKFRRNVGEGGKIIL
jgi:hypothetical protein